MLAPTKVLNYDLVTELVYRDYFDDARSNKPLLSYYNGVNPHGQLRMDEISYWGISYSLDL